MGARTDVQSCLGSSYDPSPPPTFPNRTLLQAHKTRRTTLFCFRQRQHEYSRAQLVSCLARGSFFPCSISPFRVCQPGRPDLLDRPRNLFVSAFLDWIPSRVHVHCVTLVFGVLNCFNFFSCPRSCNLFCFAPENARPFTKCVITQEGNVNFGALSFVKLRAHKARDCAYVCQFSLSFFFPDSIKLINLAAPGMLSGTSSLHQSHSCLKLSTEYLKPSRRDDQ